MLLEAGRVVLSNHEVELVESRVDQKVSKDRLYNVGVYSIMIRVQVEHVHSIAEIDEQNQRDEQEVRYVDESSQNECHVEARAVKQSEPVGDSFDALTYEHKGAQSPFSFHF